MDTDFPLRLKNMAAAAGALDVACLSMDNPRLRQGVAANNRLVSDWLADGGNAGMEYLERMAVDKADPWSTFPFARSVIVLTFTNRWGEEAAGHPFPEPAAGAPLGYISAYARENDYHHNGRTILAQLQDQLGDVGETTALVDTGAVYERLLARLGGLGEIGSNTLLCTAVCGTRVFIACLFVEKQLPELIHEARLPFSCDDCRACLNNCPTGAIGPDRPIDAGRCIGYLTIEKRSPLTGAEAASINDWIFGCDCCTSICPPAVISDRRIPVDLDWLLRSSSAEIKRTIRGNAVAYAGITQLRKNAIVVLGNIHSAKAEELIAWVKQNSGSALVREQIALLGR